MASAKPLPRSLNQSTIMKTKSAIKFPRTLRDLYSHPSFQPFGSSSDDWINDADRMERCHDAAEDGCDGSTHAEIIQDWRDLLASMVRDSSRPWYPRIMAEIEKREASISAEIDACEAWHEENGSLHSQVG